ncbi:hypothetical protein CVD28_00185 [Bacillus sp. M6-12]|uniref:hypothetical protein n=1 Tax=Bacillus sp. M6-12 TaxID=2054166 RepID=UPI000C770A4A|nr:hypothetical protein [Bacillus sp. M6-12]PLS18854.1 hypothetical protein CVD28_00185 [Bacillus sp. M6-12]
MLKRKSNKILSGILASSIVILGASVYSYSLFDSHAENPSSVVEKASTKAQPVEKKDTAKKEQVKKEQVVVAIPKQEDLFEGFVRVPHKIVAGESAWKIQNSLTPNQNIGTMLQLVSKANGNMALHPIYTGQTIYFLKEQDKSVVQATTETQTVESKTTTSQTATNSQAVQSKEGKTTQQTVANNPKPNNTGNKPSQPATPPASGGAVKIDNNTSTQDIIAMAKKSNKSSQNTVTIQYSPDVTVTLNNLTNTGEVKRNYTYSASNVEYATKVDYNVVDASIEGNKGVAHVISPDANSQAMYDISKELSALINSANGSVSTVDVYFYDNQGAVDSGNYKWKYTDANPNKVMERETFTF